MTLPVSSLGQEAATAILRSNGSVLLNHNPAANPTAIYRDDMIETQKSAAARIEIAGSAADVNPETMLQFEGDELVLDHGSLVVNTSHGLRVRVGCVTVTPVNAEAWTHYEVADVDGKVKVFATKSDVYLNARSNKLESAKDAKRSTREIVREGEQKTRSEKCGAGDLDQDHLAGRGAVFNSPWAKYGTIGLVGVLTCWALCRSDDPISPAKPSN